MPNSSSIISKCLYSLTCCSYSNHIGIPNMKCSIKFITSKGKLTGFRHRWYIPVEVYTIYGSDTSTWDSGSIATYYRLLTSCSNPLSLHTVHPAPTRRKRNTLHSSEAGWRFITVIHPLLWVTAHYTPLHRKSLVKFLNYLHPLSLHTGPAPTQRKTRERMEVRQCDASFAESNTH